MVVELVSDYAGFEKLKPVWNQVLTQSAITHPFVTHEWITTWWECFRPSGKPYILVVRDGAAIVAIAPLMITPGKMYGCPVGRLHGMSNVFSERFELMLGARPKEAAEALWGYLKSHAHEWDVLELQQVPVGSPTMTWFCGAAAQDDCPLSYWPATESPYVPISGDWETYYKNLKKAHRAGMRKRMGGLTQEGPLHMEVIESDTNFGLDFADALRLESSAWKDVKGTALSCREDTKSFFHSLLQTSAQQGWLRLYFLTVGGKRIAVRIGLLFHNRLYMLKSGYDPQYAPQAPGHVLTHNILEQAWGLKFDEVDFLGNTERWKLDWTPHVRGHAWVFVFPKRLKSRLLHNVKASVLPALRRSAVYPLLLRWASALNVEMQTGQVEKGRSTPDATRPDRRLLPLQEFLPHVRRAIHRHGLVGTSILAARSMGRFLSTALYQQEFHVWYAGGVSALACGHRLPEDMVLERAGAEAVQLLSRSNLYGWSSAETLLKAGGDLWIVRTSNEVVFCCWVFRERVPTVASSNGWIRLPPKTACIEGVATRAQDRGRGIAPAAWGLMAECLKEQGIRTVVIKVETSNRSMRKAVVKSGLEEVAFVQYRRVVGFLRHVRVKPVGHVSTSKDVVAEVQKLAA